MWHLDEIIRAYFPITLRHSRLRLCHCCHSDFTQKNNYKDLWTVGLRRWTSRVLVVTVSLIFSRFSRNTDYRHKFTSHFDFILVSRSSTIGSLAYLVVIYFKHVTSNVMHVQHITCHPRIITITIKSRNVIMLRPYQLGLHFYSSQN